MQKALDNILRHYLRQETLVSGNDGQVDEELLQSLHKCLQEKGVLKEVHSFLRQRLIAVLQGTWPQLFEHFKTDDDLLPQGLQLIEDFLCSHKLLFTLSVFSTELGEGYKPRGEFGKLRSGDAERLLEKLGIPRDSSPSLKILQLYADKGRTSLLECFLNYSPGVSILLGKEVEKEEDESEKSRRVNNFVPLEERLRKIDEKYIEKKHNNINRAGALSIDQRFRHLALALERDKQIQLQLAIDKFKSEELSRIRDEIETEQKFELLRKEKELLANYEEKVNHMKNNLEREKELWNVEKMQKEREIYERREELLLAIQSVREGSRNEEKVTNAASQTPESKKEDNDETTKTQNQFLVPQFTSAKAPVELIYEKTPGQREMEREFLLKEAKLRTVIEKLEKENRHLKTEIRPLSTPEQKSGHDYPEFSEQESSPGLRHRNVHSKSSRQKPRNPPSATVTLETKWRSPERIQKPYRSGRMEQFWYHRRKEPEPERYTREPAVPDTDTIAFLQYQLECQTEEIEKLRSVMQSGVPRSTTDQPQHKLVQARPNPPPPPCSKFLESSDVDEFLREAKKRISDIEQEAQFVEETLTRIHHGGKQPSLSGRNLNLVHGLPLPPPPTLPPSLFNRISSIPKIDPVPKYLKPGVVAARHNPKIPQVERSQVSFLNYRQKEPHPIPINVQNQDFQDDSPRFQISNQESPVSSKKRILVEQRIQSAETMSEKSFSETSVSVPLPSRSEEKNRKITKSIPKRPHVPSKTSLQSSTRKIKKQSEEIQQPLFKGDGDGGNKEEDKRRKSFECPSSESLKEKASRSGALITKKFNKSDKGQDCHGRRKSSSSASIASAVSSTSASSIAKSPEKVPIKKIESNIGDGSGKENSAKLKPTYADAAHTLPLHSIFQSLNFDDPLAKNADMSVDDLGELETSKTVAPTNDFWLM